jgi:predicted ATP-grasp superfamily ATP-dependent carboligase
VGVTRQLLPGDGPAWAPGRFQYCGSFVPARLEPVRARLALRKVGALLAAEFGLVGLFGVDVVAAGGTVHVIEVNPRYTASVEVLESASDFRGLEAHRAACVEGQLPRPATEEHAAGKLVVFARQPFTVPAEGDWPPAEETILPETADVPPPGTAVAAGDPVLTLLHRAEDYHQMSRRLAFGARAMERLIARLVPPPPQEPRPE